MGEHNEISMKIEKIEKILTCSFDCEVCVKTPEECRKDIRRILNIFLKTILKNNKNLGLYI